MYSMNNYISMLKGKSKKGPCYKKKRKKNQKKIKNYQVKKYLTKSL